MLLASLVAVAGLWYSNIQTTQANSQAQADRALTKEGQITDRYTAAVGNLGAKEMDVRLGGIYALQRIMQDSHRDHPTIANVLATYVRIHADARPAKDKDVPSDVQAAITVLSSRDVVHDRGFRPDSHGANLSHAILVNAHLADADLRGTDLRGAHLDGANLRRANLRNADLRQAHLDTADLSEAFLTKADLRGTSLDGANLYDAGLVRVDLSRANLINADLRAAHLSGADLSRAQLMSADLRAAHLVEADLSRANLKNADLRDAFLYGACLRGAYRYNARGVPYDKCASS
ncbi:pentapeptide repeat-containing protein [Streptomyces sp. NPDC020489]|uniref:pentapeptide repeat-containing protein n=1 Tax=Streptomyces sp. NPDC020489 TaxID=3365077 RepID=UPI0037B0B176